MNHGRIKKASAFCAAAVLSLSMAGTCFAGEWKDTDDGKMYIDDSGKAVTGMEEIDGETYYFSAKGIMKTGWLKTKSGKKYYFGSDGKMKTGWLRTKSGKYYLGKNGAAVTGVKQISGYYYQFDGDGIMLTGWQTDEDGNKYYYGTNGKRAINKTVTIDGKRVKFDKDGEVVVKTQKPITEEKETAPKEEIYPTEITVINDEIPVALHSDTYITFSFKPLNTTYREVTFKSSNSNIVSIDKRGKMTAKKSGSCYITITSKYDKSIFVKVKVTVT